MSGSWTPVAAAADCTRSGQGLAVRAYPVRVEGEAVSVNLAFESGDAAQAAGTQPG